MIDEAALLSILIADAYDVALAKEAWPSVMTKVCSFVGASSARVCSQHSATPEAALYFQWASDLNYEGVEEYHKLNSVVPATSFFDVAKGFSQTEIPDGHEDTRAYKEWSDPQGYVYVFVNLNKSATLAVRLRAEDGRLDAERRRKLELVIPHLRRAVAIGNVVEIHQTAETDLLQLIAGGRSSIA